MTMTEIVARALMVETVRGMRETGLDPVDEWSLLPAETREFYTQMADAAIGGVRAYWAHVGFPNAPELNAAIVDPPVGRLH